MADKNTLNKKQKEFCERYIKDFNGTRAYMEVYEMDNEKNAGISACRLLKMPKCRLYIQELIKEHVSHELTPDRILYELMDIAFDHDTPQNTRLQALQHLSKLMGMEVTKVQLEQVIFTGEDELID